VGGIFLIFAVNEYDRRRRVAIAISIQKTLHYMNVIPHTSDEREKEFVIHSVRRLW
jgi:hypothetical protein